MYEEERKKEEGAYAAMESNNARPASMGTSEEKEARPVSEAQSRARIIQPVRTFESDAAEFIKKDQQSLYTIQQAEKQKQKAEFNPEKETRQANSVLLILSMVIFIAGAASAGYFFFLRTTLEETPEPVRNTSLVPSATESVISITPEQAGTINQEIQKALGSAPLQPDQVQNILIKNGEATAEASLVLSGMSTSSPGTLLRSLDGDTYMIGAIQKETKEPFLIFSVDYYDNAFAGMLRWEAADLWKLFRNITPPSASSTVTFVEFRDGVIKNKDVRIVRDDAGNAVLIYCFYDKNTLIIAPDEIVFGDLLDGLRAAQLVR